MLRAAAFCPQPPLLVPALTGSVVPALIGSGSAELETLRRACRDAVRAATAELPVLVLGSGQRSRTHGPGAWGTLAGFGPRVDAALPAGPGMSRSAAPELPVSLTIGAWLLAQARGDATPVCAVEVGPEPPGGSLLAELTAMVAERDLAVVVLGDGSAHRGLAGAPELAARAAAYDGATAEALRGGDPAQLAKLDPDEGTALSATGTRSWQWAAALLAPGRYRAVVHYDAAPFGVGYTVAVWTQPADG